MFIEIHFPNGMPVDRDAVEEAIADALGARGEVTGAGSGAFGSNLDVVVVGIDQVGFTESMSQVLAQVGVTSARARFDGGDEWVSLVGET